MKILLVDDEPIVLESLERLLGSLGSDSWQITCVTSGASALEVLGSNPIDLIISDMRMPGMDGAELLAATAARWPKVARFALSGEVSQFQAIRAAGVAHQFLSKPCRSDAMIAALTRIDGLSSGLEAATVRSIISAAPTLPALPKIYTTLRDYIADPRVNVRTIVEVIRQDPSIAAKIVQLATSSFFFRGSTTTDLAGAIGRLGVPLIARLVLVEGLLAASAGFPAHLGYAEEARRFFNASVVAEAVVSSKMRLEASLAVLLAPVGRAVMIAADPTRVEEASALAIAEDLSIMEAERRVFGACHAAVGGHLLSLWGIAPSVVSAVALQHTPAAFVDGDEVLAAMFLANRDVRGIALAPELASATGAQALIRDWDRHTLRQGGN